jgi:UPF0716 protein FxsA
VVLLILFALFVVLPLVELVLLLQIGQAIDWPATIGLVLVTGLVGSALARWQGTKALREIQTQLASGQLPGKALFDGALILVAGAVLITPGVITDACGFLLLLPPVRSLLGRGLSSWAAKSVNVSVGGGFPGAGFPGASPEGGFPGPPQHHPMGDDVIDVTPNYSGPAREAPPPGLTLDVPSGQSQESE